MDLRAVMGKATNAVESLYDKTATISRNANATTPNGADGFAPSVVYSEVPCRISSIRLDNTEQGEANAIRYDVKLFLSSNYQLLAGDKVTVHDPIKNVNVEYESAKEPFVYVSHQEVLLIRKGLA